MSYVKYLDQLDKSQWLKRDEINRIQNKKLRFLISHAYQNIPYFNHVFKKNSLKLEDINSKEDLFKIPVQRRSTVKKYFNQLYDKSFKKGRLMNDFTSGSTTGERLKIFRDQDCINKSIAAEIRAYKWYGIDHLKEKFYYLIGADYDIKWENRFFKRLKYFLSNTIKISPIQLNTDNFDSFLSKIKKYDRRVLYGTPTGTCRLIKKLEERNEDINIEIFLNTDSYILKQQRKFIKDFFNCELYDIYGTSEVWGVAFECPEHNGYHLTSENVIMEVVDDNYEPVNPGEKGHLLLTDLTNFVMPFIRYDIGDIGVLSDEICSCGRSLHLMEPVNKQLVYRESDYILSKNNDRVYLFDLSFILDDFSKISNFQIIQKKDKNIELKIVKEKKYDKDYEKYIAEMIKEKLGNISIYFRYVDDIEPDFNGKHKFLISD